MKPLITHRRNLSSKKNKMNKLKFYSFAVLLMLAVTTTAQVKVGNNPTTILPGSLQEWETTNKALTLPRLTTVQMNSIISPVNGMFIYNTTTQCVYQYKSGKWRSLCEPDCGAVDFTGTNPNTGGTVFTPNTPMSDCSVYMGDDGSVWEWDPVSNTYITKVNPQMTEWYLEGTTNDALGNKTRQIRRYNSIAIGNKSWAPGSNSIAYGSFDTAAANYTLAGGTLSVASGVNSVALGNGAKSSGLASIAQGFQSTASGSYSQAFGFKSYAATIYSMAAGLSDTATGANGSWAIGYQNKATGDRSVALGLNTIASGLGSTTTGSQTNASSDYTTAMGYRSSAENKYAVAIGHSDTASGTGLGATAIGYQCKATGNRATAIGNANIASGAFSFSAGSNSISSGQWSVALGSLDTASGTGTIALGVNNNASGNNAIAIGNANLASGTTSVALGEQCGSLNVYAGTWGYQDTAVGIGTGAWAIGNRCKALGETSFAIGRNLASSHISSWVIGNGTLISPLTSTANEQLTAGFNGGYIFYTNAPYTTGVTLAAGGSAWASVSDIRSKNSITNIGYGLKTVMELQPTQYKYNGSNRLSLGFIAQDVKKLMPEVVEQTSMGPNKDYLAIKYTEMIPVLTKAIQEQQQIINNQQKQIEELRQLVRTVLHK